MGKKFFNVEDKTARNFVKGFMIGASSLTGLIGMAATAAVVIPDRDKETT